MTPQGFYSPQDGICLFSLRLDKKTWMADSANKSVIESLALSDEETHESGTKLGSYSSKLWPYTGEVWNFFTHESRTSLGKVFLVHRFLYSLTRLL